MIKMLFTFFRKNGGSKIRDKNIFANFIIFSTGLGGARFGLVLFRMRA